MKPENPLHLLSQKLSTGCPIIDRVLSGGIPCNSITELVAESSCGKTQLCLQLLLSAQLPISHGGLKASSLYIHSEFPFPLRRLEQLSLSFRSSYPHLFPPQDPCDFIFVRAVQSADELLVLLDRIDALLTHPPSKLPVKLVVIDSIAALFRSEFENTPADLKRRSSLFFRISGKLKSQAKRYGLAVVVTNQVVDFVASDGVNGLRVGNMRCLYSSGRQIFPALGLAWANCVNSRLFLSRNDEIVGCDSRLEDGGVKGTGVVRTRRKLQVVFAPHLPEASCEFVIVREGIFGVNM
ncbi:DNA repair protein XRCC3 homolog [Macadamia integrifolia]|uniref:DNA repair protein XRCC3 homolog n=1 Tax=Macadamia integrifolia TaxID=60698 RepID=UPI001C4FFC8C|nr:DNA repair protein XRCC3 homolog [Macadamia integrifolia]XP_042485766.1 DNA repair protein XRCC3 homolog [Macadamia integrifolia]XP_042485767.1 DNA repair protein XRCC3 homolog [Macadamia integrifolia]